MMKSRTHIAASFIAAVAVLLSSCNSSGVLSESKMVDVYVDMFIADQWLRENTSLRRVADTTLFFDPIFEKHGTDFEQFNKSLNYYSYHSEDLSNISSAVRDRLELMREQAREDYDIYAEITRINRENKVPYEKKDFSDDSVRWAASSAFWPPADTLAVTDTLAVADSLAAADSLVLSDSLAVVPNGLLLKDSSLPKDSLLKNGMMVTDGVAVEKLTLDRSDRIRMEKLKERIKNQ